MKIDEAIRYNTALKKILEKDTDQSFISAIHLGIEALKRVKTNRETYPIIDTHKLLPGETEE